MSRSTLLILSLLLLFLAAYTTYYLFRPNHSDDPPSILPNLLVQVTGQVEVRRVGSGTFVPIALGAQVQPGDTLRLVDGEASIFCGNETLWDSSPKPLSADKDNGVPCQKGRPPRPAPDLSGLRGDDDSTVSGEVPYILSPRSGFVLDEKPTLRWHLLPNVETYTVTLFSDDGKERPPVSISGGEVSYPAEWPALERGGASYNLFVEREGKASEQEEDGFSLLEEKMAEQVHDNTERLRQRPLDHLSLTLVLAELYLNDDYKLRSDVVELLLALPDGDEIVAVQRLLGEMYLAMELLNEARAAYQQALTLSTKADSPYPEEEATALMGLARVACKQADKQKARTNWEEAQKLYEQMGWAKDKVDALLGELDEACGR